MAMPRKTPNPSTGRLLDISRLLSRLHRRTPTGIDRVELAYARHYLEQSDGKGVKFLLTTPFNTGELTRPLAENVIQTAIRYWSAPAADGC